MIIITAKNSPTATRAARPRCTSSGTASFHLTRKDGLHPHAIRHATKTRKQTQRQEGADPRSYSQSVGRAPFRPQTQIPESGFEVKDLFSTYYPLATVLGTVLNEMASPSGERDTHNSASEQRISSQRPGAWPVLSPPAVPGWHRHLALFPPQALK